MLASPKYLVLVWDYSDEAWIVHHWTSNYRDALKSLKDAPGYEIRLIKCEVLKTEED